MILLDIERYRGHNLTSHLHSLVTIYHHRHHHRLHLHHHHHHHHWHSIAMHWHHQFHFFLVQVLEFVDCHGNEVLKIIRVLIVISKSLSQNYQGFHCYLKIIIISNLSGFSLLPQNYYYLTKLSGFSFFSKLLLSQKCQGFHCYLKIIWVFIIFSKVLLLSQNCQVRFSSLSKHQKITQLCVTFKSKDKRKLLIRFFNWVPRSSSPRKASGQSSPGGI